MSAWAVFDRDQRVSDWHTSADDAVTASQGMGLFIPATGIPDSDGRVALLPREGVSVRQCFHPRWEPIPPSIHDLRGWNPDHVERRPTAPRIRCVVCGYRPDSAEREEPRSGDDPSQTLPHKEKNQ